jgi:hypothetical protein
MSLEDDLGFTKEQLARFTKEVDVDLRAKIEDAFEREDAPGVALAMAEADARQAERDMGLAAQRYLH